MTLFATDTVKMYSTVTVYLWQYLLHSVSLSVCLQSVCVCDWQESGEEESEGRLSHCQHTADGIYLSGRIQNK